MTVAREAIKVLWHHPVKPLCTANVCPVQVAVNTSITDVNEFLDHIVSSTNMRCLTPPIALNGACGFLAANLYAKSAFGEDALVNVSIEKAQNGKLAGNIRIRYTLTFNAFQSIRCRVLQYLLASKPIKSLRNQSN